MRSHISNLPGRSAIFASLVLGLFSVSPALATLTDQQEAQVPSGDVLAQPNLHVSFTNTPFETVVSRVSQLSGIRFDLSPSLMSSRIDTVFEGATWQQAVKKFLRSFDHLSIVDSHGKLRKVWILARVEPAPPPSAASGHERQRRREAFSERPDAGVESIEFPLRLWRPSTGVQVPREYEALSGAGIELDIDALEALEIGQALQLDIPQLQQPVYAVLGSMHEQLNGQVQVWSGPIDGTHDSAAVTITRGQVSTYVTVATGVEIFEISIDNDSGEGVVVNEVDMSKGMDGKDFVHPPAVNLKDE